MNYYLYGPPGSGKSTIGRRLAASLDFPFIDLDEVITARAGKSIPEIFENAGEPAFRASELAALRETAEQGQESRPAVVALGGGALLSQQARQVAESSGQVLCLTAEFDTLLARASAQHGQRPLLAGNADERLRKLLVERGAHYRSFPYRLDTMEGSPEALSWKAQLALGAYRVRGMGHPYDARVEDGGLSRLGNHLRARNLTGPVVVVSDQNVGALYLESVRAALQAADFEVHTFCFPPGEAHKNIATVQSAWARFIEAGLERGSTVLALGGGVVGDLAGFAAATFLRGVSWVNLPTSLLAVVDSSLGGKTGVDLPEAKNLVGAFHPPSLVLADPLVLRSLPERELRNGLSEVVKHGVIGDPELFGLCAQGWEAVQEHLGQIARQGMAVKLRIIEEDPYEKGVRQTLNLGHTIGHGVELASGFGLLHGEAIAIGMVAEAQLAERIGLAESGLAERLSEVLSGLGLPTEIPAAIARQEIIRAMRLDKKRSSGVVRFALPVRVGEVRTGVVVEDWQHIVMDELR
jgi:shikimate kinase / 3-dehydroquinate synthase